MVFLSLCGARGHMPCLRESWFIHILVEFHTRLWLGNLLIVDDHFGTRRVIVSSFLLATRANGRYEGKGNVNVQETRHRIDHGELFSVTVN
jgi:hypothetical protein